MHLSEGPEATDRLELKAAENKDGQAKDGVGTTREGKVLRVRLQCCWSSIWGGGWW